ncbi:hypothetical protein F4806DRAFT_394868 [Annulohypoxylon nitens]|nr:hypothetical protein F4806DRAFT_394868 [Annulohypoxylon nitens]
MHMTPRTTLEHHARRFTEVNRTLCDPMRRWGKTGCTLISVALLMSEVYSFRSSTYYTRRPIVLSKKETAFKLTLIYHDEPSFLYFTIFRHSIHSFMHIRIYFLVIAFGTYRNKRKRSGNLLWAGHCNKAMALSGFFLSQEISMYFNRSDTGFYFSRI